MHVLSQGCLPAESISSWQISTRKMKKRNSPCRIKRKTCFGRSVWPPASRKWLRGLGSLTVLWWAASLRPVNGGMEFLWKCSPREIRRRSRSCCWGVSSMSSRGDSPIPCPSSWWILPCALTPAIFHEIKAVISTVVFPLVFPDMPLLTRLLWTFCNFCVSSRFRVTSF